MAAIAGTFVFSYLLLRFGHGGTGTSSHDGLMVHSGHGAGASGLLILGNLDLSLGFIFGYAMAMEWSEGHCVVELMGFQQINDLADFLVDG